MLTDRENILRMYRGEMPEFIPRFGMASVRCSWYPNVKLPGYHVDEFGVEYIGREGVFDGTPIPYPGRFLLDDIRRWREVVHIPSLRGIDWERLAREDTKNIDRKNQAFSMFYGKVFQKLTDFMGFTEGLCAMAEEPEEVCALFDALTTYYEELLKNLLFYYRPDAVCIPDDTATARAPFISIPMYREMVKPCHRRIADLVRDSGAFIEMHDCGKCDDFIPDWLDIGIAAWNPAQSMNDLQAVKRKYGRKLVICGGWNNVGPESEPEYPEEGLRQKLTEYVDSMAPGGGFVFSAMVNGSFRDPRGQQKNRLIGEFYESYVKNWYQTH